MADKNNVVSFVKYLHDSYGVSENINEYRSKVEAPVGVTEEQLSSKLETFFKSKPFYEIGLIVELDLDSGEYQVVGVKQ